MLFPFSLWSEFHFFLVDHGLSGFPMTGISFFSCRSWSFLKYKKVSNYSEKGIGNENSTVIPKSKDTKGYTDGKNSLYTQIKRQERVYWRKKLAVYPSQKTQKGILTEKTRCIPKSKDKKGYTDEKSHCIPKLKYATGYRSEKVYCIPKIVVVKYNLSQKNYM